MAENSSPEILVEAEPVYCVECNCALGEHEPRVKDYRNVYHERCWENLRRHVRLQILRGRR